MWPWGCPFFVKQGTIYTHNRICKSVIFMWYYGDPLGYSCKIWSCQYFDNPTHQCVAWYRQGLTADNQPKTLFMTFEVVISHEQKKTKRNFTSHSWNCDDAKGRIQNEWLWLGFFCHSTDMKLQSVKTATCFEYNRAKFPPENVRFCQFYFSWQQTSRYRCYYQTWNADDTSASTQN